MGSNFPIGRGAFSQAAMRRPTLFLASILMVIVGVGCNSGGGGPVIMECGGGAEFACPKGWFCGLKNECGGIDREGTCRPMPRECPLEDEPVCSCTGKTYGSPCYANASGETVAYQGPCIKDGAEGS